ncbi:MAG TPA: amidohydrolase family protein [Chitinophagaceae bacterium]|nr:amidohydrolase family protein [Chitinophagaceae bacterium]
MALLTAKKIHNGHGWLPDGSVIEVADDGTVLSLQNGPLPEAVFYDGVLTPGFVNVHCHLELSHMRGVVQENTGLIPFLKKIPQHRNDFTGEQKKAARFAGYNELLRNGVVAVGDISNTTDTIDLRALDSLHVHTFIETIGFNEDKAKESFGYALNTYSSYVAQPCNEKVLRQSIVPHAPYSVSSSLFRLIDAHNPGALISIHNQESDEEDLYYRFKKGRVPELLALFGIDDSTFVPSGRSSLQTYMDWLSPGHPFIFVHNTRSTREDIQYAIGRCNEPYWCLCPNANLYIENRLPDIDMLMSEGANICIGTDSLASNHQLCIVSELYSIKKHFPHLDWETLFTWATRNGAAALQMLGVIGIIETGKKPGILQVTGLEEIAVKPFVNRIV